MRRRLLWCWPNATPSRGRRRRWNRCVRRAPCHHDTDGPRQSTCSRRSRRCIAVTTTAGQGVPAVFPQPRAHNGLGHSRPGAVAVSTGAGEVLVSQPKPDLCRSLSPHVGLRVCLLLAIVSVTRREEQATRTWRLGVGAPPIQPFLPPSHIEHASVLSQRAYASSESREPLSANVLMSCWC